METAVKLQKKWLDSGALVVRDGKAQLKNSFGGSHSRRSSISVVACAVLSFSSIVLVMAPLRLGNAQMPRSITPLPAAKIMDLPQFQGDHKERLYWGTYRPQVYLGVRARTPESLLAGLMWLGTNKNGTTGLRHTCEQPEDLQYGWTRHNGDSYGRQEIFDGDIKITTSFVKSREEGCGYGGDWAVRVNVESRANSQSSKPVSLFFYFADEEGKSMSIWPKGMNKGAFAAGHKQEIGGWELHTKSKDQPTVNYAGFHTPYMHNLTHLVKEALESQGKGCLGDTVEKASNVAVFQITGERPFQLDFVFLSGVHEDIRTDARVANLSGEALTRTLILQEQAFEERFESTFNLDEKLFSSKSTDKERSLEVAKAAFSNLIGGIGYFYGQSEIAVPLKEQANYHEHYWLYWPASLYTAVPSRPFFPRGFLWDEGFHQLIISKWDRNISYDIIGNWLDLMNVDGWIPREQILGEESRSKVPVDFIEQHTDNANPPTFFFVYLELIQSYLKRETKGEQRKFDWQFLEKSFPRLEAWYHWFNTTQLGRLPGSYYWHGREITEKVLNAQTLTSGLDDYPRASHPSADERHVDLRCWMAFAAKAMALIAKAVGAPYDRFQMYNATAEDLSDLDKLNKLHYDYRSGRYYDFGNHTEEVTMSSHNITDPQTGLVKTIEHRIVTGTPHLQFVPHFGYVSLFPFLTRLLPADSEILGHQLNLIRDETLLWSSFGLRSLATNSSMYNAYNSVSDPPYWRGTVWINFNYLALASLRYYSLEAGPYKATAASLYKDLRQNLISNMVKQYYDSGFIWEQYDNNRHGKGKGAHPFTGWSSLLILIMSESYY